MIIDGVNYPPQKKIPTLTINKQTASTFLRLVSLFYSAAYAIARPIAESTEHLSYLKDADPNMPPPKYASGSLTPHKMKFPFTVLNATLGNVVTGDHTVGYVKSKKWFTECFDFEHLTNVLSKSIGSTSASTLTNYTKTPCAVSETWVSGVKYTTFDTAAYGLTDRDCDLYEQHYRSRINHCMNVWNDKLLNDVGILFGVIAGVIFALFLIAYVFRRLVLQRHTALAVSINSSQTVGYNTFRDQSSTMPTLDAVSLLSSTPGITIALKTYLITIEKSQDRISILSTQEQDAIEAAHRNLCCGIGQTLMDMPVLLDGRRYDFKNILSIPGVRRDPQTRLEFNLNEIQADRDTRDQIVGMVKRSASKNQLTF